MMWFPFLGQKKVPWAFRQGTRIGTGGQVKP
jgi:hypothetical protein